MTKQELASYLVSLHNLLEAQMKGQHAIPSAVLSGEYERNWTKLKEIIEKEQKDEARKSNSLNRRSDEAGAGVEGRER